MLRLNKRYTKMATVNLNETVTHEITGISFGDLTSEELISTFKDGRVASWFIEQIFTGKYP